MAVGSYSPSNKKTELYNFGTESWTTLDEDYPFCDGTGMGYFDMVYVPEMLSFFVIGGLDSNMNYMRQIAMFKDDAWYNAGQLNSYGRSVSFELTFFCISIIQF